DRNVTGVQTCALPILRVVFLRYTFIRKSNLFCIEGAKKMGTIYCIGRNFVKHIEELGNVVPEEPVVFTKTKHSIVQAKGQEIERSEERRVGKERRART